MALDKEQLDALRIDPAQRRGSRRGVAWLFALAGAALLVVGGLAAARWLQEAAPPTVQTALVARTGRAAGAVLEASGYVVARRLATVSSKVAGRIEDVFIEEGMEVERDQLLATLDASTVQVRLALALSQLEAARRGLAETEVRLAEARRQLERSARLRAERLVSEAALDAAESEVAALQARLAVSSSNVEVAARTVALRRQDEADLAIRAPFAGVVISKNAQPGEMISPNSAGGGFTRTGICTIVDMESLEIEVDVNEAYINRVRPAQRVVAQLDAYSDWEIPASVINIVPTADRQRATVRVRIGFDTLDARILPDMGVKVRFLDDAAGIPDDSPPVLATVPDAAVYREDDRVYVWVVRDGRVERRAVRVGERRGAQIGILAGVAPGERIVTASAVTLQDGMDVSTE